MRHIVPTALAAAAVVSGPGLAEARPHHHHDHQKEPRRSRAHVSLHVSRHAVLGGARLTARGRVRPGGPHRVKIALRGPGGGVAQAHTRRDGSFRLRLALDHPGIYRLRAYGIHDRRTTGSRSPARGVTAFRPAGASYYGPGLYGNGVACGGTLWPGTLGVAHKTLPCGTMVRLRYRGRTVTVPVIDRGPYVAGRDYDLTEATKTRLGFPGVGMVLASR